MSTAWGERTSGMRRGTNPESLTVPYRLTTNPGTSPTVARALALAYSATMYSNLYRSKLDVTDIGNGGVWDVDVTYGPRQKKEPEEGDFKWNFTTSGGTKHITQAKAHVSSYVPATETAVDHKGAIGITEDGSVEGTDVPDRAFKWTETWQLLLADYSFTYAGVLDVLTGTVNDAPFRGKAAGTVLFEGAEGGQSSKDPLLLEVTYHFAYSPATSGETIGAITGIAKGGWEYLWVEYAAADGGAAKRLARQPKQVNIDRVIDSADFSTLGIGTASL